MRYCTVSSPISCTSAQSQCYYAAGVAVSRKLCLLHHLGLLLAQQQAQPAAIAASVLAVMSQAACSTMHNYSQGTAAQVTGGITPSTSPHTQPQLAFIASHH